MKRLHTGVIVLDGIDILCISFSAGSMIAYGYKKYRNYRRIKITGKDPIVDELKKKSPIQIVSEKDKPMKLPLMRGGDNKIRRYSLMIKSKKLAKILKATVHIKRSQKKLRLFNDSQWTINY